MEKKNLILITMDEVRADRLTCYGYEKTATRNIDSVARDGVLFETCIASSVLTPVCHASLLSGLYPYSNGTRDPFDRFTAQSLADILRFKGYRTAGFVGNSMLGARMGFDAGFELFDEPGENDEFMWEKHTYSDPEHPGVKFPWGNWWIDRMIAWIEKNVHERFFAFGHFFHTHEGSERQLIEMGLISGEDSKSEFGFYDEKISLCDREFIGPIIRVLRKNGIYDDTILVITADHGTTLGERPLPPIPWRRDVTYPQHTTMYEPDIRIPLIIKDGNLPRNLAVRNEVKQVDIFPTLLRLLGIQSPEYVDGCDLVPLIHGRDVHEFKAAIEDLYLCRGPGALQAIRTERYKYIINQTTREEEFYDLLQDPQEKKNIINSLKPEERPLVKSFRKEASIMYGNNGFRSHQDSVNPQQFGGIETLQERDREMIIERLKALGYI